MRTFIPTEISLCRGQSLRTRVQGGTHLVITKGSVHIERTCTWLGESFPMVGTTLSEGQSHCVDHSGWVAVMALTEVQMVQHMPPSPMAEALHTLRQQTQRFLHWIGPAPKHTP